MTPSNNVLTRRENDHRERLTKAAGLAILRSFGEFLLLAVSTAAVPLIVYLDNVVLCDEVSEYSITEIGQETLLFLSTIFVFVEAWRRPAARGFLVLLGGFLACMLIRELDFLFDMIRHGAWVYPAALMAAAAIGCAVVCRDTILTPMAAFVRNKSCVYLSIGLLIVLVLSRLFGSGRLLWSDVLATDHDKSLFKTIIQEGLELFGYVFVFHGSRLLKRVRWSIRGLS